MRNTINQFKTHDPRIKYRGANASRLENLTDAVFGIAITLLIFNMGNPNSFSDLIDFAKTLPAFMLSIGFLLLIWHEHMQFARIYTLNDSWLLVFNVLFIAVVIFFVYPLRFLTLLLTSLMFGTELGIDMELEQLPFLMIYYGLAIFALYFVLFLFYYRSFKNSKSLNLNSFEIFYTKWHILKQVILFSVPLLSVGLVSWISMYSYIASAFIGGFVYWLYTPAMIWWANRFQKKSAAFPKEG